MVHRNDIRKVFILIFIYAIPFCSVPFHSFSTLNVCILVFRIVGFYVHSWYKVIFFMCQALWSDSMNVFFVIMFLVYGSLIWFFPRLFLYLWFFFWLYSLVGGSLFFFLLLIFLLLLVCSICVFQYCGLFFIYCMFTKYGGSWKTKWTSTTACYIANLFMKWKFAEYHNTVFSSQLTTVSQPRPNQNWIECYPKMVQTFWIRFIIATAVGRFITKPLLQMNVMRSAMNVWPLPFFFDIQVLLITVCQSRKKTKYTFWLLIWITDCNYFQSQNYFGHLWILNLN